MKQKYVNIMITLALLCISTGIPAAEDKQDEGVKELTGISIVGDKEAPRSLYIVPWQSSELQQATSLSNSLVDNTMQAVDRASFQRQLRLYELSKSGWHRLTPDLP